MAELNLQWAKGPDDKWYTLDGWNFADIKTIGVYNIWCVGAARNFNVRTGQGIIGARVTVHKSDTNITRHRASGTLYVTWAEVPQQYLDRVERYLAERFGPVEGDRFPDVVPLVVNLPGE